MAQKRKPTGPPEGPRRNPKRGRNPYRDDSAQPADTQHNCQTCNGQLDQANDRYQNGKWMKNCKACRDAKSSKKKTANPPTQTAVVPPVKKPAPTQTSIGTQTSKTYRTAWTQTTPRQTAPPKSTTPRRQTTLPPSSSRSSRSSGSQRSRKDKRTGNLKDLPAAGVILFDENREYYVISLQPQDLNRVFNEMVPRAMRLRILKYQREAEASEDSDGNESRASLRPAGPDKGLIRTPSNSSGSTGSSGSTRSWGTDDVDDFGNVKKSYSLSSRTDLAGRIRQCVLFAQKIDNPTAPFYTRFTLETKNPAHAAALEVLREAAEYGWAHRITSPHSWLIESSNRHETYEVGSRIPWYNPDDVACPESLSRDETHWWVARREVERLAGFWAEEDDWKKREAKMIALQRLEERMMKQQQANEERMNQSVMETVDALRKDQAEVERRQSRRQQRSDRSQSRR